MQARVSQPVTSSRATGLDGLRGYAALAVVFQHSLVMNPTMLSFLYREPATPDPVQFVLQWTPLHVLWAGNEAVLIFFVLSGLVLTIQYKRRGFSWGGYFPSRLLRLYIPVFVSVGIAAVLWSANFALFGRSSSTYVDIQHVALTPLSIVMDATLVFPVSHMNAPLWSLRWEVLFSLLLPLYVLLIRVRRTVSIVLWVLLIIALSSVGVLIQVQALAEMPIFALGVLLWPLVTENRSADGERVARDGLRGRGRVLLWIVGVLGIPASWYFFGIGLRPNLAGPIVLLSATLLVYLAATASGIGRVVLGGRAGGFLGRISFSLYLVHFPVVLAVSAAVGDGVLSKWIGPAIAITLSLGTAMLFRAAVERPSHRLASRVRSAIEQRLASRVGP